MAKIQDKFVNKAFAQLYTTAANTLSFQEIQTGMAMFEKVAWIIHRVLWFLGSSHNTELAGAGDSCTMAVVGNNQMAGLTLRDQAVYDLLELQPVNMGVPATGELLKSPYVSDLTNLPSGGIIIPPRPLYIALTTLGYAAVANVSCRIEFTYKELKGDEYWELVEATRIIE